MAKDRQHRYDCTADLLVDLEAIAAGSRRGWRAAESTRTCSTVWPARARP